MSIIPTQPTASPGLQPGPQAPQEGSSTQGLLDPQSFLQLLVDQLQNQDPLNPTTGTEFMSQVAELSQVEALQQMSQEVKSESVAEQVAASASLIGRSVEGRATDGSPVSGTVSGVALSSGSPLLEVAGSTLPLSAVTSITAGSSG